MTNNPYRPAEGYRFVNPTSGDTFMYFNDNPNGPRNSAVQCGMNGSNDCFCRADCVTDSCGEDWFCTYDESTFGFCASCPVELSCFESEFLTMSGQAACALECGGTAQPTTQVPQEPTPIPTVQVTPQPTLSTHEPTILPTMVPTFIPTMRVTSEPSTTIAPTEQATSEPSRRLT